MDDTLPRSPVPLRTWLAATRPGFLVATLVTVMLGIVLAQACGCGWDPLGAAASLVLALMTHAAVNLYNDYGDAIGGSDAVNTGRIAPFTGGSRFIQDGALSERQVRDAAQALAIVVVGGGIWLTARSGPGLLLVGLAGALLGWAYSHPGVALMSRGLGVPSVIAGWWLIVIGADYVQRHAFSAIAAVAAVSPAILLALILLVAEFPDARADAQAGKRTWVVRFGPGTAAALYVALATGAHAWAAAWWWADWLPTRAWWALGSAPLSLAAAALLLRHHRDPARLKPAIVWTLAAAVLHTVLLGAAFVSVAMLR